MESEKVKEIKKALETCMHTRVSGCGECPYNYTNTKTKHSECFRMAEHALILINELESENKRLLEQRNKTYDIWVRDTEKLRDRIAELEKKNAKLLDSVETVQNDRCVYKCVLTKEHLTKFAEKLKIECVNKIHETLKEFINE